MDHVSLAITQYVLKKSIEMSEYGSDMLIIVIVVVVECMS